MKKIIPSELITVRSYAALMNVTVPAVYLWINKGLVTVTEIDGMKFINLKENDHGNKNELSGETERPPLAKETTGDNEAG